MLNKSNTINTGAKILFTDFMRLSIAERKAHIAKYSPRMANWQKQAVLH